MKMIRKLLMKMDKLTNLIHSVRIYEDGSGKLYSGGENSLFSFGSIDSFETEAIIYIESLKQKKVLSPTVFTRQKFEVGDVAYYAGMKGKIISTDYSVIYPIRFADDGNQDKAAFTKNGLFFNHHKEPLLLTEAEYFESKKNKNKKNGKSE